MQSLRSPSWLGRLSVTAKPCLLCQHRHASLTGAIERGIRKGKRGIEGVENKRFREPAEERLPSDRRYEGLVELRHKSTRSVEGGFGPQSQARLGLTSVRPHRDSKQSLGDRRRTTTSRDNRSTNEKGQLRARTASQPDFNQGWNKHVESREYSGRHERSDHRSMPAKSGDERRRLTERREQFTGRDHGGGDKARPARDRREGGTGRGRQDGEGARYNMTEPGITIHSENDREERTKSHHADAGQRSGGNRGDNKYNSKAKPMMQAPLSVPYTTAGSDFVYGTFAVKAALQAGRRKLYKLYVYRGQDPDDQVVRDESIPKLALAAGAQVVEVAGDWNKLLSKMTGTRPHNGYVLEASPIPKLPVTALQRVDPAVMDFDVSLAYQSNEELAVNSCFTMSGSTASIKRVGPRGKFPFLLLLDRVLDPGNLGAIIRSAHFLGAAALIVVDHGTSPFSAVTVKASAGAAETFPILVVKKEHQFIKVSQVNGWKFFAAASPDSASSIAGKASQPDLNPISALDHHPCVLMVGNEGEGLRAPLQKLADGVASIENAGGSGQGVESLNVSVAAALLTQAFLKGPRLITVGEAEAGHAEGGPAEEGQQEKVF